MLSASSEFKVLRAPHGIHYFCGAILCAFINNVVLISVDAIGGALSVGVLLSWLFGGAAGYIWHSLITYRSPPTFAAFARFMVGAFFGIPLAWGLLWLLTKKLGLEMWVAGPAATSILFCYHYISSFLAIRWNKATAILRGKI